MAGVHEDFMEISEGVMLWHRTEDDRSPDQKMGYGLGYTGLKGRKRA